MNFSNKKLTLIYIVIRKKNSDEQYQLGNLLLDKIKILSADLEKSGAMGLNVLLNNQKNEIKDIDCIIESFQTNKKSLHKQERKIERLNAVMNSLNSENST